MKSSRHCVAALCVAVLSLSSQVLSADITLSGTVIGTDGKLLSGVIVSLSQAKTTTTTDALGTWSLGFPSVGIQTRQVVPSGSGRLMLEGGRLAVRFAGRDLAGRGQGVQPMATEGGSVAARTTANQDTLLYSLGNKVRLRDTVSTSQTGIVRVLDTTFNAAIIFGYLTDSRDGQTYRTVKIGSQVWMAQNLNYRSTTGKADTVGVCYNNSADSCTKYGRLYAWATVMGLNDSCNTKSCVSQLTAKLQGVCPSGWSVPSDAQWKKLTDTTLVSTVKGTMLKANSKLWSSSNGTDDFGFRVLPVGYLSLGSFDQFGNYGFFWSASEKVATSAWSRFFYRGNVFVNIDDNDKASGFSLRCLQN